MLHFEITAAFCNKLLPHFVINCQNEPNVKPQPVLTPKLNFLESCAKLFLRKGN